MEIILPAGLLLVLSAVSPLLVQYITNMAWSKNAKILLAVGISTVIAVIYGLVSGDIALAFTSLEAFITSTVPAIGSAFAIQQLIFSTLFKGSELADKLAGAPEPAENPEVDGSGYGEELPEEFESGVAEDEVVILEQD